MAVHARVPVPGEGDLTAGRGPCHAPGMAKIEVFDPAMCCPTGVCGPKINARLARFASDLEALKQAGASVTRYNLSQQPAAFVENELVAATLREKGECLPLILIDGQIVAEKSYPTREDLASLAGVSLEG